MIRCQEFLDWLAALDVDFHAGVPDSLLKPVCFYLADHAADQHVVAANEGGAVALACGYHLATGKVPLVYMQNSGQGNTINPLLSLADPEVYSIPMLLLIGWRGEPGTTDEPQHVKQGKITVDLLDAMDIPYRILESEPDAARRSVDELVAIAAAENRPVALLVRKGTFQPYKPKELASGPFELTREGAIEAVVSELGETDAAAVQRSAHFITGEVFRVMREMRRDAPPLSAMRLADLLRLHFDGQLSSTAAKTVFEQLCDSDETAEVITQRLGLRQITDDTVLRSLIAEVITQHPEQRDQYLHGKQGLFGFFIGRVMQQSAGAADPARVNDLLKEIFSSLRSENW